MLVSVQDSGPQVCTMLCQRIGKDLSLTVIRAAYSRGKASSQSKRLLSVQGMLEVENCQRVGMVLQLFVCFLIRVVHIN